MVLSKILKRLKHERDMRGRISFAFEVTTVCNLSCGFCYQGVNKRKKAVIPIDDFRKMLVWCKNTATAFKKDKIIVTPSAAGEFFLIEDACSYLHETRSILPGATIGVASNFTHFFQGVLDEIFKKRLIDNMTCSLNYSSEELYSEICGGSGLSVVYENLDTAASLIEKYKSPLVIDIAMKLHESTGKSDMEVFEKFALERWGSCVKVNWNPISCWGGHIDFKKFVPDVPPIEFPCYGLAFPVYLIKAGGDMFPCCCCATVDNAPELRLGNLFSNTGAEIAAAHAAIKNQHLRGKWKNIKLCATCNIYADEKCDIFFKDGERYF